MGIPTTYKKPRKFNFVSFLLILMAIALAYVAFQFIPPYYRKWKVKGLLADAANGIYRRRFVTGPAETEYLSQVQTKALNRLRNEGGIEDTALTVRAYKDKNTATVSADYRERITHPFVGKTTVLRFRPWSQISLANTGLGDKK
jgi:hypothetical protein